MEDAPPERRLAAGRVVLDGPGQDGVEAREGLRPIDEVDDGLRLASVHPGGDVDEDQAADQLGPPGRQDGRRHAPERHPDHGVGLGSQPLDTLRHRVGQVVRAVGAVVPPARVAVSRQVEGHEGSVEGQGDGVPRVRVHRGAVEEDEPGGPTSGPHTSGRVPPPVSATSSRRTPRPGPREPELEAFWNKLSSSYAAGPWCLNRRPPVGRVRRRTSPLAARRNASSGSACGPTRRPAAPAATTPVPWRRGAGAAGAQPQRRLPRSRGRTAGDCTPSPVTPVTPSSIPRDAPRRLARSSGPAGDGRRRRCRSVQPTGPDGRDRPVAVSATAAAPTAPPSPGCPGLGPRDHGHGRSVLDHGGRR